MSELTPEERLARLDARAVAAATCGNSADSVGADARCCAVALRSWPS